MKLNIIVCAAGEGKRFRGVGYTVSKPFIPIKGKPIIEWTTRSMPFISHHDETPLWVIDYSLTFAIREEDWEHEQTLHDIYGEGVNVVKFPRLTRGPLETALQTTLTLPSSAQNEPVLILDADNRYDGINFLWFIDKMRRKSTLFGALCYFEPMDDSAKWCFVFQNHDNILRVAETKRKNKLKL